MKYPIGIQTFSEIIEDGYVYVDKTDMVYSLATEGKVYFLGRPRRFGKSLLLSTLKSYFLGRKELFRGLKIDALEKDWKTYPVFHLTFGGQNYTKADTLDKVLDSFVADGEAEYGIAPSDQTLGIRFIKLLREAHRQTGLRCVVLVDEYDKPLLDVMGLADTVERNGLQVTLEDNNRETLKGFYSIFKDADEHLKFVFLTGVTKFSQLSVFSGFNQPRDISMASRYDAICGITEEEMELYFHDSIAQLARYNDYTYDEMLDVLRRQYDGYHFGGAARGVYNPFSLLNAFQNDTIEDFWFATGTPSYLVRLLDKSNENLNDLTGKWYDKAQFDDYRANSQVPLPMIYQSGYLTIKDYNRRMRTFMLDFPNNEVRNGFVTMLANKYLNTQEDAGSWVRDLVMSLECKDLDRFRTLLTSFLASIPYTVRRKKDEKEMERYFTYTLYLVFRIASCYITYTEKEQSYGRLDCCIVADQAVYIFEFKLDGTAAEALQQIDDKGYATEFAATGKPICKIGVSISSETGTVADWESSLMSCK